jgi:hypothetical protein
MLKEIKLVQHVKFEPNPILRTDEAIQTARFNSFSLLLRVLDVAGYTWLNNNRLQGNQFQSWNLYRNQTYVRHAGLNKLLVGNIEDPENKKYFKTIITPEEFYRREGITSQVLNEVDSYFNVQSARKAGLIF